MESQVPIIYVRELVAMLAGEGIERVDVLRDTGVPEAILGDQEASLSRFETHRVLARAAVLASPDFAIRLGHRMGPGHHGFLGHAMLCARTLRESLKTLERFAMTRGIPASFRLVEDDREGVMHFDLTVPVGRLRTQYLEWALMIALSPSLQHSRPSEAIPTSVSVTYPRPDHYLVYEQLVPCPVEFEADRNAVVFSHGVLETALVNSNTAILDFCQRRCELMLADLESGLDLSSRVRNKLLDCLPPFPSAEETARSLHMSSRMLRRSLRREGTSFRQLVQQVRRQLAQRYLGESDLTVDEVARLLGYSEPAAFSRAFKGWTGKSPTDYRRSRPD